MVLGRACSPRERRAGRNGSDGNAAARLSPRDDVRKSGLFARSAAANRPGRAVTRRPAARQSEAGVVCVGSHLACPHHVIC